MKVSLNWVRDINKRYACSADPAPHGIEKLVEKIGAQLGAVDEVIDLGKKYEGVVVAKVVSVEKHPNADKLTVCLIDDSGVVKVVKRDKNGLVQVVCGAPNVKPTLAVAWIPPGVAVPATYDKDPLVLKTREIRGVASNGMLASPKELAFGDTHEGLLIIDEDAKPGTPFAEVYGLNDYIIDIENKMFTHRPDLFGQLGVARELAGIQGHVYKSPAWYRHDLKLPKGNSRDTHPIKVENHIPKLVPRFTAVVLKDVKVRPSPLWLQSKLIRAGLKPVNNIVDITNFFMLETAQPLHAYDYDKVVESRKSKVESRKSKAGSSKTVAVIGVRLSKKGEKLKLLGGKEIALDAGAIVITNGEKPIGLGGVMGGADTEVDDGTKAIILECGTFDMNTTRKSAMAYGLFTDAATRFTKGQSPLQNIAVAAKAVDDIKRLAGGRVTSAHDNNHVPADAAGRGSLHPPVTVTAGFINSRLGLKLSASQIEKLLTNVEFKVLAKSGQLEILAPFWRTDIEIPEDIVEEVGRLYGYDHLPQVLPPRDLAPASSNPMTSFKEEIRDILSEAGGNEVLTYSFVDGSLLSSVGQNPKDAYHIRNALSPDLQYYRLSLTPSLLEKVHHNIKAGFDEFMLYEIGKGHFKDVVDDEKLPKELERVAVVIAGKHPHSGAAYFAAKKISDYIFAQLQIPAAEYEPLNPAAERRTEPYYEPSRAANIRLGGRTIGRIGEFKAALSQALKLPKFCAGFQLHTDELMSAASPVQYQPLNRFPALEQDICLRSLAGLSYGELTKFIEKFLQSAASQRGYGYGISPLDIFQRPNDRQYKQTTWRVRLWHPERTLTTEESNQLLDELAKEAKAKFKAERV